MATGCWPLRRLWQRHSRSKAADSTQNHEDGSPAASKGLDKDGAADGCSMTAPPPAEPVVCQAAPTMPARDARLSLDSMAGDEYSAYQAGLPAPSAHGSDSPWQRQLPPLQEVPPAYGVGAEDEAERLDEVRSSLAIVQGGHPGLDSITQLCAKAGGGGGAHRATGRERTEKAPASRPARAVTEDCSLAGVKMDGKQCCTLPALFCLTV